VSRRRPWWATLALLYACTNEMRFAAIGSNSSVDDAGALPGGAAGSAAMPADGGSGAVPGGSSGAGATAGSSPSEGGGGGQGGEGPVIIPQPLGPAGPFVLTLSEECEGELGPDWITYWVPEPTQPSDRTIGHTAEYVADDRVTLVGGLCIIVADNTPNGDRSYTSGTINTAGNFEQTLGYFEARIKAVSGVGVWTDWRLRTVNGWPPAIDVANIYGRDPTTVQFSNYWGAAYPNHSFFIERFTGPDFSASFHVIGVERTPTELIWYVDGIERQRTSEGADQQDPRFLSLAVLVGTGDAPAEPPDDTTVWPVELGIDWVRAWVRE
jgi:beta-glucanase (GH16 family)